MNLKEENKMLDQFQKMMESPQTRDMVFGMIAKQVASAPPERREALSRVTVTLEKTERGLNLHVSTSDNEEVEAIIRDAVGGWTEMVARGFQSMGFKVEIVE
jgi:hypothetical protein